MKTFVLIISLFLTSYLQAQYGFVPAEITLTSGEVRKGRVEYSSQDNSPRSIVFIPEGTKTRENYSASSVSLVDMGARRLIGASIRQEYSPQQLQKLDRDNAFYFRRDTVFLTVLIDGEHPLYMCKKYGDVVNFYIKGENGPVLLKYKRYLKAINGRTTFVERTNYIGQLTQYTQDAQKCGSLKKRYKKIEYKKIELMNLILAYYECLGLEPTFEVQRNIIVIPGSEMDKILSPLNPRAKKRDE
ncbi:MAG: hypothetical protein AAFO96_07575 [Bacteroidota bacterium]